MGEGESSGTQLFKRHWRDYRTATGARPFKDFMMSLSDYDRAKVQAAMKAVAVYGLRRARHVRGEIYEVRTDGETQTYRVLFATVGRFSHVLLALEGFSKKTQQTPPGLLALAEARLADWRKRGVGNQPAN